MRNSSPAHGEFLDGDVLTKSLERLAHVFSIRRFVEPHLNHGAALEVDAQLQTTLYGDAQQGNSQRYTW